jgi:hypothetical protein
MARGVVTVSRSASAHPATWKKVMAQLGAEFVLEAPYLPRSEGFTERMVTREAPRREARPTPGRGVAPAPEPPRSYAPIAFDDAVPAAAPVAQVPPPLPQHAPPPRPVPPAAVPPPLPAPAGGSSAGTGWRGEARHRSRECQESLDLGRMELAAGRGSSALAHLRRALQLAPGDAEIATEIGRAISGG